MVILTLFTSLGNEFNDAPSIDSSARTKAVSEKLLLVFEISFKISPAYFICEISFGVPIILIFFLFVILPRQF